MSEIERKMADAFLSENDIWHIRFMSAWSKFKSRFESGHRWAGGDIHAAFEAGAVYGSRYQLEKGETMTSSNNPIRTVYCEERLTKREYFAALALSGMLAVEPLTGLEEHAEAAKDAVVAADALIAALNNSMCPVCKLSNSDNHYDAERDICPIYESARADR